MAKPHQGARCQIRTAVQPLLILELLGLVCWLNHLVYWTGSFIMRTSWIHISIVLFICSWCWPSWYFSSCWFTWTVSVGLCRVDVVKRGRRWNVPLAWSTEAIKVTELANDIAWETKCPLAKSSILRLLLFFIVIVSGSNLLGLLAASVPSNRIHASGKSFS